ncbi:MAG: hypothetical protein KIT73_04215 [Burkholderiales bacterium]|nr:hypothetical protein [Burkholderiales bacterium]
MTTITKAAAVIVASASNGAGATTRATLDLRGAFGAVITAKITNGATGPSAPCRFRVLVAHNDSATPAAGAEGADWKLIHDIAATTGNSAVRTFVFWVDESVQHAQVEFTGNATQSVTVEAQASVITDIA